MGHDSDELVAPELSRVDPSFVADVVKSGDKKTLIVDVRDAHVGCASRRFGHMHGSAVFALHRFSGL